MSFDGTFVVMAGKEPNQEAFEPIRAMFELGSIRQMKQLEKLYPTNISKQLHVNYGRYIYKLHNPELFTIMELIRLSKLIGIDIAKIMNVVALEMKEKYGDKDFQQLTKKLS